MKVKGTWLVDDFNRHRPRRRRHRSPTTVTGTGPHPPTQEATRDPLLVRPARRRPLRLGRRDPHAWKAAIADLDPTDRRFRTLNQAAEGSWTPPDGPSTTPSAGAGAEPSDAGHRTPAGSAAAELDAPRPQSRSEPGLASHVATARSPAWLLGGPRRPDGQRPCAAAGYLYTQPSDDADRRRHDARPRAPPSARRRTILAYDYRHLDEDQKAAGELMTLVVPEEVRRAVRPDRRQRPGRSRPWSPSRWSPPASSGPGEDRVQVLVFVNRPTTRARRPSPASTATRS